MEKAVREGQPSLFTTFQQSIRIYQHPSHFKLANAFTLNFIRIVKIIFSFHK